MNQLFYSIHFKIERLLFKRIAGKMQNNLELTSRPITQADLDLYSGPLPSVVLSERDLLKEHFYLERFIKLLESSSNMPTLPDASLLVAIKKENNSLEEIVEARRRGKYGEFLTRKLETMTEELKKISK